MGDNTVYFESYPLTLDIRQYLVILEVCLFRRKLKTDRISSLYKGGCLSDWATRSFSPSL